MRPLRRAASAALLMTALCLPAHAQTDATPAIQPVGSSFPADVIRDLPVGDSVYALLETTQPEIIADRFNSGGLNVGRDARVGGFLGSWSQTRFRIGDLDISDPMGSGASLIVPDALLWQRVNIATGLMPADVNTAGLAVTLEPLLPGEDWTTSVTGTGTGADLAAGAPSGQPIPIARLKDYLHAAVTTGGRLSPRAGFVAGGTWARGRSYSRERLASADDTAGSGFVHVTLGGPDGRAWRTLVLVQRSDGPFASWQPYNDPDAASTTTSWHAQTTIEQRAPGAMGWRVFGGVTGRTRRTTLGSTLARMDRIVDGPVPPVADAAADTDTMRVAGGLRLATPSDATSRHRFSAGADVDSASATISNAFTGIVRESVNGVPARIWNFTAPAADARRRATTFAAFVSDTIALTDRAVLDAGVRFEAVHGAADSAATDISWFTLLPHAYLRLPLGQRRALTIGYSRSANALNLDWLAYGDPAAVTATVSAAAHPGLVVSRVGPGTGGDRSFTRIDPALHRPYTDEVVIEFEKRRSASTRYTLTGIARREASLAGVVNSAAAAANWSVVSIPDAGKDLTDPSDDRDLLVYNRLPASFGTDSYELTSPGQDAATVFALRAAFERSTDRLFLLVGATASAAEGSGGNRGYGPLENDQDVLGELFTNPNGASYARGRLFSDRAFTIKWTTAYRFRGDVTVGAIARYQDGQPFSRLVLVPDLNQGAEAVQAYPNAGSRYTFTGTLDLRVQKGFRIGRTTLDAILDAYNLLTRNNEVEEYVVSDPAFRTPTAIQPPPSLHLGLRLTF